MQTGHSRREQAPTGDPGRPRTGQTLRARFGGCSARLKALESAAAHLRPGLACACRASHLQQHDRAVASTCRGAHSKRQRSSSCRRGRRPVRLTGAGTKQVRSVQEGGRQGEEKHEENRIGGTRGDWKKWRLILISQLAGVRSSCDGSRDTVQGVLWAARRQQQPLAARLVVGCCAPHGAAAAARARKVVVMLFLRGCYCAAAGGGKVYCSVVGQSWY